MRTLEWTDGKLEDRLERLDERFGAVERQRREDREWVGHRFDEVDRRIKEGREETGRRFDEVDRRLTGIEELKQDMKALQATFQRGNLTLVISIFGVLVATILKGG
jgi:hypothetical protein